MKEFTTIQSIWRLGSVPDLDNGAKLAGIGDNQSMNPTDMQRHLASAVLFYFSYPSPMKHKTNATRPVSTSRKQ